MTKCFTAPFTIMNRMNSANYLSAGTGLTPSFLLYGARDRTQNFTHAKQTLCRWAMLPPSLNNLLGVFGNHFFFLCHSHSVTALAGVSLQELCLYLFVPTFSVQNPCLWGPGDSVISFSFSWHLDSGAMSGAEWEHGCLGQEGAGLELQLC